MRCLLLVGGCAWLGLEVAPQLCTRHSGKFFSLLFFFGLQSVEVRLIACKRGADSIEEFFLARLQLFCLALIVIGDAWITMSFKPATDLYCR